ncbi:SigE family RNA polymerase sigma factor [Dactylosporangium sp. CS-033363]|uniref:SigE family RNA polymerase sigma factor n=1 Tax=Dactylosporangium sp. CS-033363 TaxID=3239935 RepID=UPI003D91E3CE
MHAVTATDKEAAGVPGEGFEQFVRLRYAELLRTAYLLTGSVAGAEDLVQSCLLKVMPRFERIDEPLPYLRRAMVNQRTSWWRALRRELLSARVPERAGGDPAAAYTERSALVAELKKLPERMRAVLVLRYWEDLSEAETAAVLGCSVGSVKSQASRGLARLRVLLESGERSGR